MDKNNNRDLPTDPSQIFQLATAYWGSSILLTANRLRLFSIIGKDEKAASEIAERLGAVLHYTEMFLNACVSLGFLEKVNGRFKNSPLSEGFLIEGGQSYLGDALKYSDDLYPVWGRLEETIRSGMPALNPETILGGDKEKTRNFILGMHNRALGVGKTLADRLDLGNRKRLLDVGGGPGTYSILLAKKNTGLRSRVMDLAGVIEIAQEIIRGFQMEERVEVISGDYTKDPLPDGNDCLLYSGIFHREPADSCKRLIDKAFNVLEHGGLIIINDIFCNKEKDGPPFAMLFGINMLLTSEFGTVHSIFELTEWLTQAGFIDIRHEPLPPPMPHTIIQGVKP